MLSKTLQASCDGIVGSVHDVLPETLGYLRIDTGRCGLRSKWRRLSFDLTPMSPYGAEF